MQQIMSGCRFLEHGDLHNCLRHDKEGNLRWYQWCACRTWQPDDHSESISFVIVMIRTPKGCKFLCCAGCSAPWMGGRPQPGLGKQIALDIARGLAFMHNHCIVHLVQFCFSSRPTG